MSISSRKCSWIILRFYPLLQNHILCVFVANLKIGAIYALYPESFCDKNLAIQKVFAFCDSEGLVSKFKITKLFKIFPPSIAHRGSAPAKILSLTTPHPPWCCSTGGCETLRLKSFIIIFFQQEENQTSTIVHRRKNVCDQRSGGELTAATVRPRPSPQ